MRENLPGGERGRLGIGVDMEQASRFRGKKKGSRFLERLFTRRELAYCFSKHDPAQHLAARFAAKEAVFKALCSAGKAGGGGFDPRHIEISAGKGGLPMAKVINPKLHYVRIYVSMSHSNDMAVAFAVARAGKTGGLLHEQGRHTRNDSKGR